MTSAYTWFMRISRHRLYPALPVRCWIWLLLIPCVLLTGCQSASPSPSSTPPITAGPTVQPLRIAFLYYGKISDGSWTQAHEEGRQALIKAIPGLQTIYLEDTPAGPEAAVVLRKLAQERYDLIVATSIVFADAVSSVADEYPRVRFLQCEGEQTTANVGTYYGKIEEPFYLAGLLAGSTTKTNQIGFVAAYPLDDIIHEIDAFTLGARRANAQATVVVRWTMDWADREKERSETTILIDIGCDVIAQHQDTPVPQQIAQERGVFSIGFNTDMAPSATKAVLASVVWNWGDYYTSTVRRIQQDTWTATVFRGDLQQGTVGLTTLSAFAPEAGKTLVREVKAQMEAGAFGLDQIFAGPLADQQGKVRVPEGKTLNDEELQQVDWFVQGVVGSIPSD